MFDNVPYMSKMIQLRLVPDALHKRLKARAAREGLALSDFLIREARKVIERPSPSEMMARLAARDPVPTLPESPAATLRAMRDGH